MSKTKKIIAMAIALVAIMTAIPLFAAYANRQTSVTIDGVLVRFPDQLPVMVDNRTMVPVRGVFEHMGFYVTWNNDARLAILTRDDVRIVIPEGARSFLVGHRVIVPDVPQQMIGDRMMLPLRAVAEAIGGTATWNANNRVAQITSGYEIPRPTPAPTPTPTPAPTPTGEQPSSTPEPTPTAPNIHNPSTDGEWYITEALLGTWYYMGYAYYVFHDDGHGTWSGDAILWQTYNGMLIICTSPTTYSTPFENPWQWYYDVNDEGLYLLSATEVQVMVNFSRAPQHEEDDEDEDDSPGDGLTRAPELFGTWYATYDFSLETYTFKANGEGLIFGEMPFYWSTNEDVLYMYVIRDIYYDPSLMRLTSYYYSVDGNLLHLANRDVYGTLTLYRRALTR